MFYIKHMAVVFLLLFENLNQYNVTKIWVIITRIYFNKLMLVHSLIVIYVIHNNKCVYEENFKYKQVVIIILRYSICFKERR